MVDRTTKLRWRRRFRRSQKQVEDLGVQAEEQLEKNFFKRLSRLTKVRRFVTAWVLLFVFLIAGVLYQARGLGKFYLTPQPATGGIFTEGIVGTFTNANPIYASGSVDNSVARLVFAGLFKFDQNNKLIGDLARTWEVDESGKTYTVKLKPNLKWHDGKDITSQDVVYTYSMIKNPDAKSVLASSWQGIKVEAKDKLTIVFTLPNPLSAFPYSMTNGIVPKHKLDGIPPSQLRSVSFNATSPVGSGPFKWEAVEVLGGDDSDSREQRIALLPFDGYNGGTPKIDKYIIRAARNEDKLIEAFKNKSIDSIAGLSKMPEALSDDKAVNEFNIPLTSEVMVFLKTNVEGLNDIKVRQAIAYATDTGKIVDEIGRPVSPVQSPLLPGQVGYDKSVLQKTNNLEEAKKLLDQAGWALGADGLRYKNNRPLSFKFYTQSNPTYDYVAQSLKAQWKRVGVDAEIISQEDVDFQSTLSAHIYDALLYGIALGPDPDVFVYWHSSQVDPRAPVRLNFSEYKSGAADKALEGGRTRNDPLVRAAKYKPFLEAWRNDVPAIALYQPKYLYVTRLKIANFAPSALNSGTDRLNNVVNWLIREQDQVIK